MSLKTVGYVRDVLLLFPTIISYYYLRYYNLRYYTTTIYVTILLFTLLYYYYLRYYTKGLRPEFLIRNIQEPVYKEPDKFGTVPKLSVTARSVCLHVV